MGPARGFLLKHAQVRFAEIAGPAPAPPEIGGREAAMPRAVSAQPPASRGEITRRISGDEDDQVPRALWDRISVRLQFANVILFGTRV